MRSTLADICEVTERAGEVIGGLRAMLKRDSTVASLTNVDVNNVIRIVERIVHGDANLHKVTIHLDLSSDVRAVKGDSVQLQQVILNLMLNAFSAMSGTNGARRLVVRTNSTDESQVLVAVQDSGAGIAAEQLESIFDPFVTSKPGGLGMGLSICRSIIERHGGTISAANNPGRGATFSITLPVAGGGNPTRGTCGTVLARSRLFPCAGLSHSYSFRPWPCRRPWCRHCTSTSTSDTITLITTTDQPRTIIPVQLTGTIILQQAMRTIRPGRPTGASRVATRSV